MGRALAVTALLAAGSCLAADWPALKRHQQSITRAEFDQLLTAVYCPSGAFTNYLAYTDDSVTVFSTTGKTTALFTLRFAATASTPTASKPIQRIALDPGHIGGKWAQFEERHFVHGTDRPIDEAALNLTVARLLKTRLEAAGRTVLLTKNDFNPITDKRPPLARLDIAARARRINEKLKPDLTVCLHFNAIAVDKQFHLVADNRLTVFIHGNYQPGELDDDDQKFYLLAKLLERTHATELAAAESVATALAKATGLEPLPAADNSIHVGPNPHVLARNLAAGRWYHGPVIYCEPYYMNNATVYQRLQLGDYDGEREVEGRRYRSIFREYADAVADGLLK